MKTLEDLPLEIWLHLLDLTVGQGNGVDVKDIFNLSLVNSRMRRMMTKNVLWYDIFNLKYGFKIRSFGLNPKLKGFQAFKNRHYCFEPTVKYYEMTLEVYMKEVNLIHLAPKYHPIKNEYNLSFFLDTFGKDSRLIAVFQSYKKKLHENLFKDQSLVLISPLSLVENLIYSHTFKIALHNFEEICKNDFQENLSSDFEWFWFSIGLFDPAFDELLHHRSKKLKVISDKIDDLILNILDSGKFEVELNRHPPGEGSKPILTFSGEKVFIRVFSSLIKVVSGEIGMKRASQEFSEGESENKGYFLEDYSLMRIYSNYNRGHPYLVLSILMKTIHDNISCKYAVQILGLQAVELNVFISFGFLCINNHYFKISNNASALEIYHFRKRDVINHMVNNLGIRSRHELEEKLAPITLKRLVTTFLQLRGNEDIIHSPNRRLIERGVAELSKKDSSKFEPIPVPYKCEDFYFAIDLCESIFNRVHPDIILSFQRPDEFDRTVSIGRNFIHVPTILKMQTCSEILGPIRGNTSGDIIKNIIGDQYLSVKDAPNFEKGRKVGLKVGSIVKHKRFNSIGIILNFLEGAQGVEDSTYVRVISVFGRIEVYNTAYLNQIQYHSPLEKLKFLFSLLRTSGDVIGLLYFKSIKFESSEISFVTYK